MVLSEKNRIISCLAILLFLSTPILANNGSLDYNSNSCGLIALASSLCISLASCVGTLAQSSVARAALEGMARNPEVSGKVFVPMILALALIESLVLFSLLVALSLAGKVV